MKKSKKLSITGVFLMASIFAAIGLFAEIVVYGAIVNTLFSWVGGAVGTLASAVWNVKHS